MFPLKPLIRRIGEFLKGLYLTFSIIPGGAFVYFLELTTEIAFVIKTGRNSNLLNSVFSIFKKYCCLGKSIINNILNRRNMNIAVKKRQKAAFTDSYYFCQFVKIQRRLIVIVNVM